MRLIVFTPFQSWRHEHAVHHAAAGATLAGVGDVFTLTVAGYHALPYAAGSSTGCSGTPFVMFGLGPIHAMIVSPRWPSSGRSAAIRRSIIATDVALVVIIGGLCWLIGWRDYLLLQAPILWLAGATGVWLFYVQHQFEDTYWQRSDGWAYADAALRGSSYLKLPKVLQFFTGNIGLHHVHHLSARIPNYNLQRAHDENPIFRDVPTLSLWDGLRACD